MKFLNLHTGYSFDGIWTEEQQNGYIFWFPNEQSVGITYSMPIAIVSDSGETLKIEIEDNNIFSLVTHDNIIEEIIVDGYAFNEPEYTNSLDINPESVGEKYVYIFNVSCCGESAGEYICKINIGDEGHYIKVGADLYGEYEPVYVNLSNFGVEIPNSVQKAIYDSNVHEDMTDHILMNRKFKELLSNYWDVIANKGSYKSLKNSLEWFEWDDNLKVREIWKHYDAGNTIYDDRELCSILEDKLEESMTNFIKTTYVSLYCSMQEELDAYDEEMNPKLQDVVLKWSRNDVQLKLALMAQFFGIYFLPMHMSILHATIEDEVFTNTIKTIIAGEIKRQDHIGDLTYVECNVKDNEIFYIGNVQAQVSNNTKFAIRYPTTDDFFGVDEFPSFALINDENIKTFSTQYYAGPGAIIPFEFTISNQSDGDFIHKTIVCLNGVSYEFYDIFNVDDVNRKINVKFNLLIKSAGSHSMLLNFILASGKTITRKIDFCTEDIENLNINIYKVKSKDNKIKFTYDDFYDTEVSKYLFKIQNNIDNTYYHLSLPYMSNDNPDFKKYTGVKLTRTIVISLKNDILPNDEKLKYLRSIMQSNFLEFIKRNDNNEITYLIYVSKKFYAETPTLLFNNIYSFEYDIIRNDLGFYPQFHYLEKMNGNTIDDYTVSQYDALCCAAEINNGNKVEEFRYGHMIKDTEWTFTNTVTGKDIEYPESSLQPFIVDKNIIETGYYDIQFKYSLTNGVTNTCRLNSAVRIKNI